MDGRTPLLIMIQGHEPGARWKLQETRVTTIGRSSKNQISLVSPTVSRFHCEVSCINGLWHITDLNSRKGTYLNGGRIGQREVLRPGDLVRLSTTVLRFELVDETSREDDGLLAIREASLDGEMERKGESLASLEAIRLRSQLSALPDDGRRGNGRLAINVAFVFSVAIAVALAVGGSVAYARGRRSRTLRQRAEAAAEALAHAEAVADTGEHREALATLRRVVEGHADMPEAGLAAERYRQVEDAWFGREMAEIAAAEKRSEYPDALRRCSELLAGLSDPALKRLARQRQTYTERLARAAPAGVPELEGGAGTGAQDEQPPAND